MTPNECYEPLSRNLITALKDPKIGRAIISITDRFRLQVTNRPLFRKNHQSQNFEPFQDNF